MLAGISKSRNEMLACTALNLVMKCSLLITMGLDTKYIIIIIEKSNNCMRRAQFPFHLNLGSWNYSVKIDPAQKPDPDSRLSQKKLQTNCLQSTQFILDKNLIYTLKAHQLLQVQCMSSTRGGRPPTPISLPSHILLIFSSEPPRNPRPSIFMCFKVSNP